MCEGVSETHQHEKWGISGPAQQFVTSQETAYPKAIASVFVRALQNITEESRCHQKPCPISAGDSAVLPAVRAQAGLQSKVSKFHHSFQPFPAELHSQGTSQNCRRWSFNMPLRHCPRGQAFASFSLPAA